jgi:hypothetical protein
MTSALAGIAVSVSPDVTVALSGAADPVRWRAQAHAKF